MNRDRVLGQTETIMENKFSHLPDELLIQVLLRLPVKSLLRFRCVSKSWFSIISDPHFAKSHFELGAAHTHRLVILGAYSSPKTRSIDASLHDDSDTRTLKLHLLPAAHSGHGEILGSCRGFLLLMNDLGGLFLWNPSNGVLRVPSLSPLLWPRICLHGLGYDPSTDDYLVALGSCDLPNLSVLTHLQIFSLRANSWREIQISHILDGLYYTTRSGWLLHGVLHWLAYRYDADANVIVALNLTEMSVLEILPPVELEPGSRNYGLWVLGGFLSLYLRYPNKTYIWVMKQYKVQSSWTKSVVVTIDDIPTRILTPICSTKSGDIILETDGFDTTQLVKCNSKGEVLERRSHPPRTTPRCVAYAESLLSFPDSGQGQVDHTDNNINNNNNNRHE